MNIKSTSVNPFKFITARTLWGGDKNNGAVIVGTITQTVFASVLGAVLGLFKFYNFNVLGSIAITVLLASLVFTGITLIALLFAGDFDRDDWRRWMRLIIYNVVVLSFMVYMFKDASPILTEKVKSVDLVKTDITGCKFSVRLQSEHLQYEMCSDDNANFEIFKNPPNVHLVGSIKFGNNKAKSIEYIDKHIVLK